MKKVLLVDEHDNSLGYMEKMEAHKNGGKLHRAFSVFLYDGEKMLIQKRASTKYHCPSLYTNSCCSHPLDDDIKYYAKKRLVEELGIDLKKIHLKEVKTMLYKKTFTNSLTEYEYDHLLISEYKSKSFCLNLKEVSEVVWIDFDSLLKDIKINKDKYTYWFKKSVEDVIAIIRKQKKTM